MSEPEMVERDVLVYAIWALFGFGGLAFVMEGFSRDAYFLSLAGVVIILAGFVAHMVVNAVFDTSFRAGEVALGIGAFAIFGLAFIGAWALGALSVADYWSGLTLFGLLALGLPVYLATRYGFRGAFSRLSVKPNDTGTSRR